MGRSLWATAEGGSMGNSFQISSHLFKNKIPAFLVCLSINHIKGSFINRRDLITGHQGEWGVDRMDLQVQMSCLIIGPIQFPTETKHTAADR